MKIKRNKYYKRMRRAYKLRSKLKSLNVVRLVIHRTSRHMYAQIIDSDFKTVLVCASTLEKKLQKFIFGYSGNKQSAGLIGKIIAKRAIDKGIKFVSFDRSGLKYHGRVKFLAECARKTGLKF